MCHLNLESYTGERRAKLHLLEQPQKLISQVSPKTLMMEVGDNLSLAQCGARLGAHAAPASPERLYDQALTHVTARRSARGHDTFALIIPKTGANLARPAKSCVNRLCRPGSSSIFRRPLFMTTALTWLRRNGVHCLAKVFHRPESLRHASSHSRRHFQRLVHFDEVVPDGVIATMWTWLSNFFEKALVRRVMRGFAMRIVRLARSICDVLTCTGSGLPSIRVLVAPGQTAEP